jgi:hypothetical protein
MLMLVIGATSASATSSEIERYGIEQQQTALGMGNPEADTIEKWESRRMIITVEPESAGCA